MSERIHNFSAGPGVLPEPVLRQAQSDLWSHGDFGIGIVECSHRSAQFDAVIESARARIHRLLGCDEDQTVLFLHGGARTQFHSLPMNLLRGDRAAYHITGTWAKGAVAEARRFGTCDVLFDSSETNWDRVPAPGEAADPSPGTVYLHYTSNNTVAGGQYHHIPEVPDGTWLACDMSSDFLSRPIDGSRFGFIYAGAQKNVGPSGSTVVVIRKSHLERCDPDLPKMLQYPLMVEKNSMYNTPCTFSIYVIDLVTKWIEDMGGLQAVAERNRIQADKVYAAIDATDFYRGKVLPDSRSQMNVTFTTGDADRDTRFWKTAAERGLSGLKGHRSVGGLRASLYNAQTNAAVDALVDFMRDFEAANG